MSGGAYRPYWQLLGLTGQTLANGTAFPGNNTTVVLFSTAHAAPALQRQFLGLNFKNFVLNIFSDQASAANGVKAYDSNNGGTDWDQTVDNSGNPIQDAVVANTYFKLQWSVTAPDLEVRYTNSATNVTVFRWSLIGDPMIP